jgi:putative ABC transport system substrate-binding protein
MRIAAGAIRARLPTISAPRVFAADGGLMSYGMDIADDFRLSASYVVKVAQGAKAADLPIELPTRYELTVNLRTAAALGIRMPREVMLLANGTIK